MQEILSTSAAETRKIGSKLAAFLQPGDVILLNGDLGAGKSEFTRGIAQGLGIKGAVPSPSFTILNVYDDGRVPLYHFDWYRLHSEEELYEMGMNEYLGGDGIAVVEWPSVCPDAVPDSYLEIQLVPSSADSHNDISSNSRLIRITSHGNFRQILL